MTSHWALLSDLETLYPVIGSGTGDQFNLCRDVFWAEVVIGIKRARMMNRHISSSFTFPRLIAS